MSGPRIGMPKTNPLGGPVGPVDIGIPTSFPQGSQAKLEALSSKPVGPKKPAAGPGIQTSSLGTVTRGIYTVPQGRPPDTARPDPTRWAPVAKNTTGGPPGPAFADRAIRAAAERLKFAGQPPPPAGAGAALLKGGSVPNSVPAHLLKGGAASMDWRTWLDAQDGGGRQLSGGAAPAKPRVVSTFESAPAPASTPASIQAASLAGGAVWKMDPTLLAKGGAVKRKRAPPGPDSSTARRSAKVKELCKSHGMTVPQASSYIKTHGIKW